MLLEEDYLAYKRSESGWYQKQWTSLHTHKLSTLGPTLIKGAQSLSSRPDLMGTDTAKVLSELQDRSAPFPDGEAMAVIEQELGVPLGQVFSRISVDPMAAAPFGHRPDS